MGNYTGLRMRGQLRAEAVPVVDFILNRGAFYTWQEARSRFPEIVSERFALRPRTSFIPFGHVAMQWNPDDPDWRRELKDGYFVFQCSVKDDGVIDAFLCDIAPKLFETVDHCELLYCEMDVSALYALEEGKFITKRHQHQYDFGQGSISEQMTPQPEPPGYRSPWMIAKGIT